MVPGGNSGKPADAGHLLCRVPAWGWARGRTRSVNLGAWEGHRRGDVSLFTLCEAKLQLGRC